MSSLISLELRDSIGKNHRIFTDDGENWRASAYQHHKYTAPNVPEVEVALRALQGLFRDHIAPVPVISLTARTRLKTVLSESDILDYEIRSYVNNQQGRPDSLFIYTGPYVGFYQTRVRIGQRAQQTVQIAMKPRYGSALFNYLVSYATGLYLPEGDSQVQKRGEALWLIALMWKAALAQAMARSHIPKGYRDKHANLGTFKGKLHLQQHFRHNLVDHSRFYCSFRELTTDTMINRTIRYTYYLLSHKGFAPLLSDIGAYDGRLQSFGVPVVNVTSRQIDRIIFNRLNAAYRMSMQLSRFIIAHELFSSTADSAPQQSFAYFLDMSELWESYLIRVLERHLPDPYRVVAGNFAQDEFLLQGQNRQLKPDIVIYREQKPVAILDAKYKAYRRFGHQHGADIAREDLYQMNTYLLHYHFRYGARKLIGLFVSPLKQAKDDDQLYLYNGNSDLAVGLLNLDLTRCENMVAGASITAEMRNVEAAFARRLEQHMRQFGEP